MRRWWRWCGIWYEPCSYTTIAASIPFITALIVTLVAGDFASTFFYHVPQHLWFTLHLRTHHDRRRSYLDHAVHLARSRGAARRLSRVGAVSRCRGALWRLSWPGAVSGPRVGSAARLVAPHEPSSDGRRRMAAAACYSRWRSCSPRTTMATTETPISSLAIFFASTTRRLGRFWRRLAPTSRQSAERRQARRRGGYLPEPNREIE